MAVISLSGATKDFGRNRALDGVDLELHAGEVHALVGENGSGKSTLLRVLAGVHRLSGGTMAMDGRELVFHRPAEAIEEGIVLVSQEGSLVPDLSVAENVLLGRLPRRGRIVDWAEAHRSASVHLAALGLDVDPATITRSLPPDQRQLVELARALSQRSRVVLLDEPTSTLDLEETERLLATVRRLADGGLSIVIVSHRMSEIMSIGDRFTVLRDGLLVGSRSRADGVDEQWLVHAMVGRTLDRLNTGEPTPDRGEPVLEVRDLQDRAGKLSPVSLTVRRGEIVGLAGLVGAGRTELLETVIGHRVRVRGEVHVAGRAVPPSVRGSLRAGLALLAEDRKAQALLPSRSIEDNATLALPLARGLVRRRARDLSRALPWLERFETKYASFAQPIGALSGGNQQKVLLARVLAISPHVLLLDEPTRGIDLGAKRRIYEEIIALAGRGMGVVVASSELPEVIALCHRVLVVREGAVVRELVGADITEEAIVSAATGAASHA